MWLVHELVIFLFCIRFPLIVAIWVKLLFQDGSSIGEMSIALLNLFCKTWLSCGIHFHCLSSFFAPSIDRGVTLQSFYTLDGRCVYKFIARVEIHHVYVRLILDLWWVNWWILNNFSDLGIDRFYMSLWDCSNLVWRIQILSLFARAWWYFFSRCGTFYNTSVVAWLVIIAHLI